ncbi:MAG: methionyl-tRNA formyltransferase [Syntrophobacteraceae bacterium CG23_combo_of_CG06-09_8_20_14_all_50_8]|nr:MAG: methionyl-tRNA formyltransferase [Syntrophobacteraceae bacterium CG23_combo_of_CG06-09_8_20_14_all_50_8]
MTKPRILFMGTAEFAVPALALLVEQNYPLVGVVTQPDRPRGRGKALQPSPVKIFATSCNLPVLQPERVRDNAFLKTLRQLAPDLVALAAFGQILPGEITGRPPLACLNIHPSLLPKYRGAAPINWAIINGEKKTGITIIQMVEELDAGDILLQEEIAIGPEEAFDQLHDRLSCRGAELLIQAIEKTISGSARGVAQDGSSATYAPRLKKEDGLIHWEHNVESIVNLIRGLSSHPGAHTFLDGKKLKILGAKAEATAMGEAPGTISRQKGMGLTVAAGNGYVHLLDVQMENKKRMPAEDFLRGYQCRAGSLLG